MAMKEAIGFIGLGAMGAPMVRRLLSLGYVVVVFDVDSRSMETAQAIGALTAASPQDVAQRAAIVCTCLPSLEALRNVILGATGITQGNKVEVLIDFSTTGSEFARDLAKSLSTRGIAFLDSPITGGVVTAGNGGLGIMCSGPRAAYSRVDAILQCLAAAVVLYLGDRSGTAQTLKLLNNLLSATGMATTCEAVLLGAKAGLDPWRVIEVINASDASSSASRNKFPKSVLPRRFDYGARMSITAKDTSLTVEEAEALNVPMWIGQAVRQVWNVASAQGGASNDASSLITYLEPWAGIVLNPCTAEAQSIDIAKSGVPAHLIVLGDASVQTLLAASGERSEEATGIEPETWIDVDANARADSVFAMLPSPSARSARTVVNLSSMGNGEAEILAQKISQAGDTFVEARQIGPTSDWGTPKGVFLVAGAMDACSKVIPWLTQGGGRALWVSAKPADAMLMRDIHDAVFGTLLGVTCEAFAAGAKAGLVTQSMVRIMGVETGRNAASATILPDHVATRRFSYGRSIGEIKASLDRVSQRADELSMTPWILNKARLLYGLASSLGSPTDDVSRLAVHYERWTGAQVSAATAPQGFITPLKTEGTL